MRPIDVKLVLLLAGAVALGGCTYLRHTMLQRHYADTYSHEPGQWLAKHLIDRQTFFVHGRLTAPGQADGPAPLAVIALSGQHRPDEVVDVNHLGQAQSHFGLNLPAGEYRLLVLADADHDGVYEQNRSLGERRVVLDANAFPGRVAGGIDIALEAPRPLRLATSAAPISVPAPPAARQSVVFPRGTLRTLDDPIFSGVMRQLGIFDPAAFMEAAPMMFYALEEERGYKVPVVFVHGLGGAPGEFRSMLEGLDRSLYKPFFFYYPSGASLYQLAQLFHDIFLSGQLMPTGEVPIVVIAHSMGGLIVREAMNIRAGTQAANRVALIVTIVTPFGGDPAAGLGARHAPLVVPAWRDLVPDGPFITGLFRTALPSGVAHVAVLAHLGESGGEGDSDGVVPISHQIPPPARDQVTAIHSFRSGHVEVLSDPASIAVILGLVHGVRTPFPATHLRYLQMGGFPVTLGPGYSERQRYMIATYGAYFRAIAKGALLPIHPEQEHFLQVVRGAAMPVNEAEEAWLRFRADHPLLAAGAADADAVPARP